jgi:DNA-binding CsgD family transcriptional regulator
MELMEAGAPVVGESGSPGDEGVRRRQSSTLFMSGRLGASLEHADATLDQPDLAPSAYAGAELARLRALMCLDRIHDAQRLAEEILAGRPRPAGDLALVGALNTLAFVAWEAGRLDPALGLIRASVVRSEVGPPGVQGSFPRLFLTDMLTSIGEFDEAAGVLTVAAQQIERSGELAWTPAVASLRARLLQASGRQHDAETAARDALAVADALDAGFFAPVAHNVLATTALWRGEVPGAARWVGSPDAPVSQTGVTGWPGSVWAHVKLTEVQQGPVRALEVLDRVCGSPTHMTRLLVDEPAGAAWWVRGALSVGDRVAATAVANCAALLAAGNPDTPALMAAADHARGLLGEDADLLQRAAGRYRHPWARGSAAEDAGVALIGVDPDTARTRFDCAATAYGACGATRDVSRVRRRRSRRRRRRVSGWESLTVTEGRVAALVSQGLTNAQVADRMYLSRHTIDFHLRQVFRKLQINSRVELTRLVVARDSALV